MKFACPGFAVLALAFSVPAAAGLPQVQPGRFRCTAPAHQTLEQDILPLKAGQELRIAFRLTKTDTTRAPLAFVRFGGSKGPSRIAVGRARTDRPRMYAAANAPGSGIEDPTYYFPLTKDWIVLRLALDRKGLLTVRSNSLKRTFKWGTVSRTALGCRFGEWEIDVWPRSYLPAASAPQPRLIQVTTIPPPPVVVSLSPPPSGPSQPVEARGNLAVTDSPPPRIIAVTPPVPPPVMVPHAPPMPPPPAFHIVSGPQPRAPAQSYVSRDDYPVSALAMRQQGRVRMQLVVGTDGRVASCAILASSGSAALDSASCNILRRRSRFTPARDSNGNPARSTIVQTIEWTLPR